MPNESSGDPAEAAAYAAAVDAGEAVGHVRAIAAAPRPAGGPGERAARDYCRARLVAWGWAVSEEPFDYSGAPGRLATPLVGWLSMVTLAGAAAEGARQRPSAALVLLAAAALVIVCGSWWLARRGVLALPWMRASSANLVAASAGGQTGGDGAPRVWLVAHLDSKSQPVPIGVRAAGVVGTVLVWTAALALASAQRAGAGVSSLWPWLAATGVAAALPLAASVVRARSPGALDDASGVAAVLGVARLVRDVPGIGVLLTSAEELGLAGARAWVRGRGPALAVNVDGLDDVGVLRAMWSSGRPGALAAAFGAAAAAAGVATRVGRLLPGILVDGVALADAGWEVLTLSKGTPRTVARIHTAGDVASALDGRGIAEAAAVVTEMLRNSAVAARPIAGGG